MAREHDARADTRDADPRILGRRRGRLPTPAHVGREVGAGRVVLGDGVVAPVPVVADRRARHEHGRLPVQGCEGLGEERRAAGAALEHEALAVRRPALVADARPREVHDGAHPLERRPVDRARDRIPTSRVARTVVRAVVGTADQTHDAAAVTPQRRDQRRTDEAVRAGDEHVGGHRAQPNGSSYRRHGQ